MNVEQIKLDLTKKRVRLPFLVFERPTKIKYSYPLNSDDDDDDDDDALACAAEKNNRENLAGLI